MGKSKNKKTKSSGSNRIEKLRALARSVRLKSANPDSFLKQFNQAIGLRSFQHPQKFWQWFERHYGESGVHLSELMERREMSPEHIRDASSNAEFYALKNSNTDMSLQFTTAVSGTLHNSFFRWLLDAAISDSENILDIGCDNGYLTCFLATVFSDATVIGIDVAERGLKCGAELAERLGLDNVQFICTPIEDASSELGDRKFQLAVSLNVFYQLLPDLEVPEVFTNAGALAADSVKPIEHQGIGTLSELLDPNSGIYVAAERFPNFIDLYHWALTLKQSGLEIDWRASQKLVFQEMGDLVNNSSQKIPVTVGRLTGADEEGSLIDLCLGFAIDDQLTSRFGSDPLMDQAAEVFFDAIGEKELIKGVQIAYHLHRGGGIERKEVWTSGSMLLVYRSSNRGYRELVLCSALKREDSLIELQSFLEERRSVGECTEYSSLDERGT